MAFWRGQAPESILRLFPSLTLAQVYGAIAFYLSNQTEIDAYLKEWEMRTEEQRLAARRAHPDLHERLTTARQETSVPRS